MNLGVKGLSGSEINFFSKSPAGDQRTTLRHQLTEVGRQKLKRKMLFDF